MRIKKQLLAQNLELEVTEPAKALLAEKGFDPDFGARPLRRVIQNTIEDELAERLLSGQLKSGGTSRSTATATKSRSRPRKPRRRPWRSHPPVQPELAGSAS